MYLSLVIVLSGAGLVLGSFSPLPGKSVFILLAQQWYILPEGQRLITASGKQYESYQMRTRRWL